MAITVQLTADESSINSGQATSYIVAISNTGASALNVSSIVMSTSPNSAVASVSAPVLGPAAVKQIAATSGVVRYACQGVFYASQTLDTADTEQTPIGVYATVATSDGTNTASNTVTMQVTPNASPAIAMPSRGGQLRFDSNNNSNLLVVL
jgi:hypothetical protein